jgi:hypothetical protein
VGEELNVALRDKGRVVWQDNLLQPGDQWRDVLETAIQSAAGVLILVTHTRISRTFRGQSDEEVDFARNMKRRIVPILVGVSSVDLAKSNLPFLADLKGVAISRPNGREVAFLAKELERLLPDSAATPLETSLDPDDPLRGAWGGSASRNGRALRARVSEVPDSTDWYTIVLEVVADDGAPLEGGVDFHLHPTFNPSVRRVDVHDGAARLTLWAWGAFTVGAAADGGRTKLELNLADLSEAPPRFRER